MASLRKALVGLALGLFASLAQGRPLDNLKIGVALFHVCLLDEEEGQITDPTASIHCYDEKGNPLPVPAALDHPTGIAVGYRLGGGGAGRERSYSCAIQPAGVVCWGSLGDRLTQRFHKLRAPYLIASGDSDLCIADKTAGLQCHGGDHPWTFIAELQPQLGPLRELALGNYYACALTAEAGIRCWGGVKESYRDYVPKILLPHLGALDAKMKSPPQGLGAPHSLSVGTSHACVLNRLADGSDEKHCWGVFLKGEGTFPPDQKRLEWVQAGLFRTFGIADSHAFVLGDSEPPWVPALLQTGSAYPRLIATSKTDYLRYYSVCIVTDAALNCRGAMDFPKEVPMPVYGFHLLKFENTLNRIRNYVYRPKALVIDEVVSLARELGEDSKLARLFLLNVLEPLVLNTSSQVFLTVLRPAYTAALNYHNEPAVFSLRDTGITPWHIQASLKLLHVCFTSLSDYRMPTRHLMLALGHARVRAKGTAIPRAEVAEVVAEIEKLQDALSVVGKKPRTLGIVGMIQTLNAYLKGAAL